MSDYTNTLSHSIELQGDFSASSANGYALLDYPPSIHLAWFQANRLDRFLRLTRSNLRMAFGHERGDRCMQLIVSRRSYSR